MNKNLFFRLDESDYPLIVRGVNQNSSPMMVMYEGSTIFGVVYYSENCVANVLSLGSTIDNSFRVRYLHLNDEFLVQVTEGSDTYIFKRDTNTNTYICDLDKDVCDGKYINSKENNTLVSTVAQNKKKL